MGERTSSWQSCLYPVFGIGLATLFAYFFSLFYPYIMDVKDVGGLTDAAIRFFGFGITMIGWANGIAASGRALYCGGSRQVECDHEKAKVGWFSHAGFYGALFLMLLVFTDWLWLMVPLIGLYLAVLVGEVGWGNPMKFIDWSDERNGKGYI